MCTRRAQLRIQLCVQNNLGTVFPYLPRFGIPNLGESITSTWLRRCCYYKLASPPNLWQSPNGRHGTGTRSQTRSVRSATLCAGRHRRRRRPPRPLGRLGCLGRLGRLGRPTRLCRLSRPRGTPGQRSARSACSAPQRHRAAWRCCRRC